MDKEVVHIYAMEYYTAKEKNEIKPFVAAWMDPEIIILNEVNQTSPGIKPTSTALQVDSLPSGSSNNNQDGTMNGEGPTS